MSKHKKPTVSEIRAWSEMLATRQWDIQRISYLLGLVKRMGEALGRCDHAIETAIYCEDGLDGAEGQRVIKEARALVEESKQ